MNESRPEVSQLARLLATLRLLREQCPWDRQQTLADLAKHLIEEAYEAADAIARGDPRAIADELGDLLAQTLFAAVVAEQEGASPVGPLISQAADKLVRRHPHVYGRSKAEDVAQVVAQWDQIKSEERQAKGFRSALDGIAGNLPALMRAQKLGTQARRAGMDWADIHAVLAKVREEMDELEGALASDDRDGAGQELGDMLLAVANAPRFIGHDAEQTLGRACDKFIRRFKVLEHIAGVRGLQLKQLTTAEVDELWQEAKRLDQEGA